jgi:gliding motility-associated lipoprotein GldH
MKPSLLFLVLSVLFFSCDQEKVYHAYVDFEERTWLSNKVPQFTFTIEDTTQAYNVYCNLRNTTRYPYARIFIQYSLTDTLGNKLDERLLHDYLFDAKTGEPRGSSGLGDLYDHRLTILKSHTFRTRGPYRIRFEQYMRTDTLTGVVSVGLGVERATAD